MLDIQKLLTSCWSGKTAGWKIKIISDWPIIVGNLHNHARVEKVYDDTVVLGVYDTCWMQELHLLSNILIKKINAHLQSPYIKQIRLKYVQKHHFKQIPNLSPNLAKTDNYHLSAQEQQALKKIQDPELRHAIAAFLNRCTHEQSN